MVKIWKLWKSRFSHFLNSLISTLDLLAEMSVMSRGICTRKSIALIRFWKKVELRPLSATKAFYKTLTVDKNEEPGTSRENEQVGETVEDYLAWFMNRSHIEPLDKMDELDDFMEKERSFLESWFMNHSLLVIIYESLFTSHTLWVISNASFFMSHYLWVMRKILNFYEFSKENSWLYWGPRYEFHNLNQ